MSHLPHLISDLGLILGAAAVITLIFKRLKQPLVLGYIVAGLLVGPNFNLFPTIVEIHSIQTWAEIGVIFLLFGLGLEFSFKKLVKVGGVAVVTALMGIGFTMGMGYAMGSLLGWASMDSLFLGGILAIASTTIIFRAFEELGVKSQKFTGVVMGVLVIEDLVAVVLMVVLSTVAVTRTFEGGTMMVSIFKLAFFLVLWFISGIFFLPSFLKAIRKLMSEETLLIVSLALCFLMVVLANQAGFSSALGAFIMGSILAETTKAEKIEHLLKPVKDLFGAIFFVSVGMLINVQTMIDYAWPITIATLILLIGKPTFVIIGALISGQPLKIAVQSGMSLSQIGEFSFIIATLGLSLNVTSDFLYPVAVAVSVLTTFTTPFMIRLSPAVHRLLENKLPNRLTNAINRYSAGTVEVKDTGDWKRLIRFYFMNMVVFSVIIATIILLSTQYILPLFSESSWSKALTATVTLVILSPFLWALAFRRTQPQAYANVWVKPVQRVPLVALMLLRILLALFFVGFLFGRLFSPWVAVAGVLATLVILLAFSKKIREFYARIELRFLSNLNERDDQQQAAPLLTPWDTHLAVFTLSAESHYIGKTLEESRIREEFGVNIAAIERGNHILNVPSRDQRLYPHDVISVIGTDDQLDNFRTHLESMIREPELMPTKQSVSLQHFVIQKESPLLGKTIRHSGIRERTKGLVVGIERKGERILNPESDLVFELKDIVWIVGNEKRIQVLSKGKQTA